MNLKSIYKVLFFSVLLFCFYPVKAQQTSFDPLSYYIFTPFIYNPAITGSKDFISTGFNASFRKESNSQLLSADSRLYKKNPGYFSSPDISQFRNTGLGGTIFRDANDNQTNTGLSLAGSFQLPVSRSRLSFLSFGLAAKGTYSRPVSKSSETETKFNGNFDAGIYYYGPSFFAGASVINILKNTAITDTVGVFARQYFFITGARFVLVSKWNMVMEPSLLYNAHDSLFSNLADKISPILKLYIQDFSIGTSYRNDGKLSFFSQYKYPAFYVGIYYELTTKTAYYKNSPLVEFTFGLNLKSGRSGYTNHSHW